MRQPHVLLCLGVLQQGRCGHRAEDRRRRDESAGTPQRAHGRAPHSVDREDQGDGHRQEEAKVDVGVDLQGPAGDESRQRPAAVGLEPPVQAEEREQAPSRAEHLQPRHLTAHEVRAAHHDDAGDDRRILSPGQGPHEHEHRRAEEREAQQEGDVVEEDRVAGQPVDRRHEHGNADQVFGERQGIGMRMEDGRVPQRRGTGHGGVADPAQNPGVQHGIAGIAGQRLRQMRQQLTVEYEGDHDEEEQGSGHKHPAPGFRAGHAATSKQLSRQRPRIRLSCRLGPSGTRRAGDQAATVVAKSRRRAPSIADSDTGLVT